MTLYPPSLRRITGVTLVELMVTVFILSIGVLAALGSFKYISLSLQNSKARTLANNLAQEQIEKLKNLSYYTLLVTTSPYSDTRFTPALDYDTGNYSAQTLIEGGISYRRATRVDLVYQNGANITAVPATDNDTGLKLITVYVIWGSTPDIHFQEMHNLMANPAANPLNATFRGTVTNTATGLPIAGALVQVVDNSNWFGITNNSGVYQFSVSQGSYTLICSTQGYFSKTTPSYLSIASGQTYTQDFALGKMGTGSASGYIYLTDHLVISQVVGSTYNVTTSQCQEYVELYNPTTSYIQMVQGMAVAKVNLKVQNWNEATPTTINLTYSVLNASVAPRGYFLIANYPTVYVNGAAVAADATISASNPAYPNVIRTRGGPDASCEPDVGNADAIGIAWASTGEWIDRIGWRRNGVGHTPEFYETNGMVQTTGFQDHEFYVRYSAPGVAPTTYGPAYDSNDNSIDIGVHTDVDITPRNRNSTPSTVISGTPATGAMVAFTDALSQTTICNATTVGGFNVCSFTTPGIATGTWVMVASSGTYYQETLNVTMTPSLSTSVPNGGTNPTWPASSYSHTILNDTTNYAFISGVVQNVAGVGLSGITISASGINTQTGSGGRYFLSVSTGDIVLLANYNNQNRAYTTQSSTLTVYPGMVYDVPTGPGKTYFTLSLGGILTGYIKTGSNTPLPGRVAVALSGGNVAAQAVSGSDGYFYLNNLTTGTYVVEPSLDPAEVAYPSSATVTLTSTGTATSVSTFTVTSGLAEITGQVLASSTPITTGVLVIASTATLSGGSTSPPPTIQGADSILCDPCSYGASSDSTGQFSISLRSSTTPYKLYGWYTTFSGTTPTVTRAGPYSVNVSTAGQIVSQNLTW